MMQMATFHIFCVAVLTSLAAATASPVYANNLRYPDPVKASGKITFLVAPDVQALVVFRVSDDPFRGDQVSYKYADSAGHSYALGPVDGNFYSNSVFYDDLTRRMNVTGKVTVTSNSSWLALDTSVLFVFTDSGQKGGGGDYVQLWYGASSETVFWDPLLVTKGNIVTSIPRT